MNKSIQYIKEKEEEEKKAEEQLRNLLVEIFRFDLEDLDFGIYRIMNFKRDEIKNFIENDLLKAVESEFKELYKEDRKDLEKELGELRKKIVKDLGTDAFDENGNLGEFYQKTPLGKEYMDKLKALESVENVVVDKAEIFSRVYEFFNRYYMDGDLIPIRRYTRYNDYIIPYNGEEVYLHWANKDQYYVKTTEYFQKYTFRAGSYNVTFRLREAHIDKNNVKGKDKFFVLSSQDFVDINGPEITVFFEYRELTNDEWSRLGLGNRANKTTIKEALINDAVNRINDALAKHPDMKKQLNKKYVKKNGEETDKTILEMHILTYVAKNTKDYFIHKNLKKFFLTELDFYIKNEMLNMEDIERWDEETLRRNMRRVRVFKNISTKIIEFLSEIEEFEKMLWEKKKFVLKTEYVITLDKIKEYAGEKFLVGNKNEKGIVHDILGNEKQLREWKELFGVDVQEKKDLIAKMNVEGKKEWKKLPVDTKYFDEEFKWNLITALSKEHDLDDILDGLLIKSENWQALNLMMEKYRERIKTIYIDPPYNTGASQFLYKNSYRHSSWNSMIYHILKISKEMMRDDSTIFVAIDDFEIFNLGKIMDEIYTHDNKLNILVTEIKPSGRTNDLFLATSHEYYLCYSIDPKKVQVNFFPLSDDKKNEYKFVDDIGTYKWRDFLRTGGYSTPQERPNSFYPIYYNENTGEISLEKKAGWIEILPIDSNGKKRVWRKTRPSFLEHVRKGDILIKKTSSGYKVYIKDRIKEGVRPKSVWTGPKYDAATYGTKLLINMFSQNVFDFPKSAYAVEDVIRIVSGLKDIVLDFFAGSGTTAHAVMMLNKEDGGKRKFILVEMADYFDTVIIPRIKKVAYSFNWKDGKPQDIDGIGVFFKYNTLEQYEDTLNNIIFAKDKERQAKLKEFEDYIFHILEYGTRGSMSWLNIDQFKKPFSYKMEILENGIPKTMNVDLVETFNYLLGLHLKRYYVENANDRKYVWVVGERRDGSLVVVVWRNTEGLDLMEDRNHIESKIKDLVGKEPDAIYINSDSIVSGANRTESEFMRLMGA